MAKLAIIFNKRKLLGKLTKLFTGEYAYHQGWVVDDIFYDQHLLLRRRNWPKYESDQVELYDFPEVTKEFLEYQLTNDNSTYGFYDYILFALRPIYHLFGKSTVNAHGQICSEKCANDLRNCGVKVPWMPTDPPPSPADLYRWAQGLPDRSLNN